MYIKTTDKGWKIDLALTAETPWVSSGTRPDPMNGENIVHFIHSDLIKTRGPIQKLKIVVISLNLVIQTESWGPSCIGKWRLQTGYDLTDLIHQRAYCQRVLGIDLVNTSEEDEEILLAGDKTAFIRDLSPSGYYTAFQMLNNIRFQRTTKRSKNPRTSRDQKFKDDSLDISLSRILSRVNAVLNEMLYWGIDLDHARKYWFNPDSTAYC